MNRSRPLGPRDTPHRPFGDAGWMGVNMRLDASQLQASWASDAQNMRFKDGIAETRKGSLTVPWLNNVTAAGYYHWTTVYGVGRFRNPTDAVNYTLVAADGNVYACLPNNAPVALSLPSGVTITQTCRFQQAFNVVLCLRGFEADALVMDNVTAGFTEIEARPEGTGLLTIPRCLRGVFMSNRVFLLREDDTLVASDVLDYTHYTALNDLRINQGDADKGVALVYANGRGTVVEISVGRIQIGGDVSFLSMVRLPSADRPQLIWRFHASFDSLVAHSPLFAPSVPRTDFSSAASLFCPPSAPSGGVGLQHRPCSAPPPGCCRGRSGRRRRRSRGPRRSAAPRGSRGRAGSLRRNPAGRSTARP
jgi:hypothetical protein